ncbi:MAG: 50S ribosomal protein L13 [Planctomycetes bacterium]|nr:50S ribosomal protein L13 [Planctomycetota bacterium]MCB9868360.1 50S ribosomal protein L13 [Planctomycetota bacterium]
MATWHVVDASKYVLGKLGVAIAEILMGKTKPIYTPHMQCGDGVIVINAQRVRVTGQKRDKRTYLFYSGFPGGLKEASLQQMLDNKPDELIKLVVRRMLPKNRLAKHMLKRLKVYPGADHPHRAQQPANLDLPI